MARFFIDHPVFAMVIAIVIVILGATAIPSLPVAAYREVVPPVIQITANYLGGNSEDLEKTVAQPIEEQLVGFDHMLYFLSTSGNDGSLNIRQLPRLQLRLSAVRLRTTVPSNEQISASRSSN